MRSAWRISNRIELNGLGGEKADGRWHTASPGKRIVYLSEHPAVCLIELLVNLKGDSQFFPDHYQLLKIKVADSVSEAVLDSALLTENWRDDLDETRALGNAWLASNQTALLIVPSAPAPESQNYLFNPLHPNAQNVTIEWHKQIAYDRRLFQFQVTNALTGQHPCGNLL